MCRQARGGRLTSFLPTRRGRWSSTGSTQGDFKSERSIWMIQSYAESFGLGGQWKRGAALHCGHHPVMDSQPEPCVSCRRTQAVSGSHTAHPHSKFGRRLTLRQYRPVGAQHRCLGSSWHRKSPNLSSTLISTSQSLCDGDRMLLVAIH